MSTSSPGGISIEFLRSRVGTSADAEFDISTLFISGRYRLGEGLSTVLELPAGSSDEKFRGLPSDQALRAKGGERTLGVPYVGVEVRRDGARFFPEFGIRIPFWPDRWDPGLINEALPDRVDAFYMDATSIIGMLNAVFGNRSGSGIRIRAGLNLCYDFDGSLELRLPDEFYIHYGVHGWMRSGLFRFFGGLVGRSASYHVKSFGLEEKLFQTVLGVGVINEPIEVGFRIHSNHSAKQWVALTLGTYMSIYFQ